MYTKRNHYRNSRLKKTTVSQKIKNSEKIFGVSLIFLVGVLGFVCMFKTVSIATNGYDINVYEKELDKVQRENQKMIIELADLKAVYNLEGEFDNLVAVENNNIQYITVSSSAMAMEK